MGVVSDDVDRLGDLIDRIVGDLALPRVVRGDSSGSAPIQRAYGLAHRRLGISHVVGTQFATKRGSKGLTALTVMSLVERGELGPDTAARSVLGDDLP